jgi:hypothetical protein
VEMLEDSNGFAIWLYFDGASGTNISVGLGIPGQNYDGFLDVFPWTPFFQFNPEPTSFFWVPLPVEQNPLPGTLFASWTDWIEWDIDAHQLWWGKDITISPSQIKSPSTQSWVFYYREL